MVLLLDVLEHVEDDKVFLSDLITSMKAGASLLLTVPAHMSLWTDHDVLSGHQRRYDAESLQLLWEELPVRLRLFTPFNTYLYPFAKLVRSLKRLTGCGGLDLWLPPRPLNMLLTMVFSSETRRLLKALNVSSCRAFRHGGAQESQK